MNDDMEKEIVSLKDELSNRKKEKEDVIKKNEENKRLRREKVS